MTQILYSNQTIRITIPSGQSIAISTASGSYSAYVVNGFYKNTVLATSSSTGAVFGPYINGGAVIELSVSNNAIVSYDVGVSPVLTFKPDSQYSLDSNGDVNGFIAPDGTLIGLVSTASLSADTGASLVGYLPTDGNPSATTVAARLALLDGISPTVTGLDAQAAAAVNSLRDATAVVGGTPGWVNAGIWNRTIAGAAETSFEWGIVGVMDNYATAGENVAIYGQGNKRAAGTTWAGCFEARDFTQVANPTAGLIGIEVDVFGNGSDASGNRVGIDLVAGKGVSGGDPCVVGWGIRLGPINNDPSQASFGAGILLQGNMTTGISIASTGTWGINFSGAKTIGIDLSSGTHSAAAIRIKEDEYLAFDSSSVHKLKFNSGGALQYLKNTDVLFSVFDSGDVSLFGPVLINTTQVLTARRTGYTNAMTGTADRATAYDTSTISLAQLAQRVKAIEDDLLTHGLIGV